MSRRRKSSHLKPGRSSRQSRRASTPSWSTSFFYPNGLGASLHSGPAGAYVVLDPSGSVDMSAVMSGTDGFEPSYGDSPHECVRGDSLDANPLFDPRSVYEGLWEAAAAGAGYYMIALSDFVIWGRVLGQVNSAEDLGVYADRVMHVEAFSCLATSGEHGEVQLHDVIPICRESFEAARRASWPHFSNVLMNRDYWALEALDRYRRKAGPHVR